MLVAASACSPTAGCRAIATGEIPFGEAPILSKPPLIEGNSGSATSLRGVNCMGQVRSYVFGTNV